MMQAKSRDKKHLLQASNDSLQCPEEDEESAAYDTRFTGNVNGAVFDDGQQELAGNSSDAEGTGQCFWPGPPGGAETTPASHDSNSSFEREIAALNREMEHIKFDCREIIESHTDDRVRTRHCAVNTVATRPDFFKSPRLVPKMGTRIDYLRQVRALQEGLDPSWPTQQVHVYEEIPESHFCDKGTHLDPDRTEPTCSGRSPPDEPPSLPPFNFDFQHRVYEKDESPLLPELPLMMLDTCSSPEKGVSSGMARSPSSTHSVSRLSQTDDEGVASSLQQVYAQYADVMYTNSANLQHTIQVQQQLFQQQLSHHAGSRKRHSKSHKGASGEGGHAGSVHSKLGAHPLASFPGHKVEMKWVVKKRADGTRYITRRPIRSKLLKKRAWIVAAERAGTTTDDEEDATSELKVGRYWPKEERKRHLERARDHKRKKEMSLKLKMDALKELEEAKKSSAAAVETTQKRTGKRKGRKLLDDFTAIQEVLGRGGRDGAQASANNPLLSVTTV